MVNVEVLRDAEGRESFRVSRVFPNAASAECACRALERVNPEAFEGLGQVTVPPPNEDVPPRPELVVDEDVIPGCPNGLCGLD
jgi:hypothetical protein